MKRTLIIAGILGLCLCLTPSAQAYSYRNGHHYTKVSYHHPHKERKVYRYGFHILHDIFSDRKCERHNHRKYRRAKHNYRRGHKKVCKVYYEGYGHHRNQVKKCIYR